jgi:hypothetical protein
MPLLHDGERWGIPSGRTPTTHILKPPAQEDLDGFDINEHFCLRLAKELGFAIVESPPRTFAGQQALVVERYPRLVHYREAKLAMRVDREYHLWKIQRRHWEGLAVRCELDPEPLVERVTELVAAVPPAVERATPAVRDEGIDHDVVEHLESEIRKHSEDCLRTLERVG